jgi:hypothetical protein
MAGRFAVVLLVAAACGEDNGVPSLGSLEVTTDEDTPVELRVLDGLVDPEGDALVVTRATAPGHAVEIVRSATILVSPTRNFHGTFEVEYQVSDTEELVFGRATVIVRSVNDLPVASDRTIAVHRPTAVELAATDVDGDPLTYVVVTGPAHGSVTGTGATLMYTPETGYVGDDAIGYVARDGSEASAIATVHLDVTLGAAPVAMAATVAATEDQSSAVVLVASDADGDALAYEIATPPAHGTLTGTAPNLTYTPEPDFSGPDSFTFRATDGTLTSSAATISIAVAGVNDRPVAAADPATVAEDGTVTIAMRATDADGDAVTFEVQAFTGNGSLTGSGATRTYRPFTDYHGPDSFTFVARDATSTSQPVTVAIAVTPVNDPPTASGTSRTIAEDTQASITLAAFDRDGDALTFAITSPAHGTVSGVPPNVTYTPSANYNGSDSFTFTVSDGTATSASVTVSIFMTAVGDAPIATNSAVTTPEDIPVGITLQAVDPDGPIPSISITTFPVDGTLTGSGTAWTYTPALDATGTRTFRFAAFDNTGQSFATVTITMTPVNDPPKVVDDFVATDPGHALTIDVVRNDVEVDGEPIAVDAVGTAAHGTVALVDDDVVYTPAPGFTGIDTFTYTAMDPNATTATATVHVGVGPGQFPAGGARDELIAAIADLSTTQAEFAPSISSDGRYVAFAALLGLVPEDTNGISDIYVFDRGTRALEYISVGHDGTRGNGASYYPQISADGRYVGFQSIAPNLVAGDTGSTFDIFRRDRATGTTIRVSATSTGGQPSGHSTTPVMSDDGNVIAFQSVAFDLVADDANGAIDVFVRDIAAGTTARASVSSSGGDADLSSTEAAISGDGRVVAFSSSATNLVAGDANLTRDVFVRDLTTGTTTRVSVGSTGTEANKQSFGPSLSTTGRFVSFISEATNLVPGATGFRMIYVRDTQAITTTSPVTTTGMVSASLSGDGRYLAAFSSSGVFIRDRFGAQTHTPPGASAMLWPALSRNGRYAIVLTTAAGGTVVAIGNPL